MTVQLHNGDCLDVLATLPEASIDACCCDPPYGLSFMGKAWDHGVPGVAYWQAIRRVLKPGAYLLAFGGSRTYHRMACAVEDAGFTIRDCVLWLHGQGFPKSHACLKPAYEPIVLAWNPAEVVTPLRIEESRIGTEPIESTGVISGRWREMEGRTDRQEAKPSISIGRWPANILHDGSPEVLEAFAVAGERTSGSGLRRPNRTERVNCYNGGRGPDPYEREGDSGSAARFFYCSKATKRDRDRGNTHSTVKPTALMRWLVGLVSKPDDVVLDPFLGSGTTGVACHQLHRSFVGIELDPTYFKIADRRLNRQAARYALFDRPTG